ncbi:MAG: hypothetical protein R2848_06170 [Thermomicrobiales bacterium]
MSKSITFDFHNTLIECDEWFQIEIRTLVSDVLRYWHDLREIEVPPQMLQAADLEYRRLRQAIHVHGHELPADRSVRTILERIGFVLLGCDRHCPGRDHAQRFPACSPGRRSTRNGSTARRSRNPARRRLERGAS